MSKNKKNIPSTVKTNLVITPDQMRKAITKVKSQAVKEVSIKGFRKGMAPQHLAEKALDAQKIEQQALSEIIPSLLETALLAEKEQSDRTRVIVIADPQYHIATFGWPKNEDTIVEATVALYPEVYTGHILDELVVTKPETISVTEEQIDEFVERLKTNFAKIAEKDQKEYSDVELLKALKSETMDEFRQKARVELEADAKYQSEQKYEQSVIDAIVDATEVDVPEALIRREVVRILESMSQQLKRIGATMETYLDSQGKTIEQFQTDLQEQARKNVISMLALTELTNDLEIQLTDDERAEILKSGNNEQQETVALMLRQRKALEELKNRMAAR